NNPKRMISYSPKHIEIQQKPGEKPNVVLELYLTEIIQHWYDFLEDVYKKALTDNYYNNCGYQLSSQKILLDFNSKDNQLYDDIISKSVLDFNFLPAKEKLRILKKLFNADFSDCESELDNLKENIQVRNILQHRLGFIEVKDISDLDGTKIKEDHGDKIVEKSAGQRVSRTVFDLENLVLDLKKISANLVEKCT
ncbi:hypothetical protein NTE23_003891, partial [Vibrio mimicus]